jgi:ABC-2 type transport system ATP-binding protein
VGSFQSPLLSIGVRRPTLDDVFIKLTGRNIRDEEAGIKEQMKGMMMRGGHGR